MTILRQSDAGTGARFALLSAFYAGVAYLGFLAMFLYTVGFVSGAAVPRTIDSGGPRSNTATAVVIDVLLLALFAVQHTAMARPAFKGRWTRIVPGSRGTIDLRPRRDSSAGTGVLAVAADPGGRVAGARWGRMDRVVGGVPGGDGLWS